MTGCKKIDMDTWARREHYEYYTKQFWVLAKFKYPTHQINFCTREALKCLEYRGYEETR